MFRVTLGLVVLKKSIGALGVTVGGEPNEFVHVIPRPALNKSEISEGSKTRFQISFSFLIVP